MAQAPRSRAWWRAAVSRWRRSGQSAIAFAAREGINPKTLLWWSSQLRRDTRADHGSTALVPLEIEVPRVATAPAPLEIDVSSLVIRCEVGSDVGYVASLVRALRGT